MPKFAERRPVTPDEVDRARRYMADHYATVKDLLAQGRKLSWIASNRKIGTEAFEQALKEYEAGLGVGEGSGTTQPTQASGTQNPTTENPPNPETVPSPQVAQQQADALPSGGYSPGGTSQERSPTAPPEKVYVTGMIPSGVPTVSEVAGPFEVPS